VYEDGFSRDITAEPSVEINDPFTGRVS
jgi:hypothetical protein